MTVLLHPAADPLLTMLEVADMLRCDPREASKLVRRHMAHMKRGGRAGPVLVKRSEVQAYIDREIEKCRAEALAIASSSATTDMNSAGPSPEDIRAARAWARRTFNRRNSGERRSSKSTEASNERPAS